MILITVEAAGNTREALVCALESAADFLRCEPEFPAKVDAGADKSECMDTEQTSEPVYHWTLSTIDKNATPVTLP